MLMEAAVLPVDSRIRDLEESPANGSVDDERLKAAPLLHAQKRSQAMFLCKVCKFECEADDLVAGSVCCRCTYGPVNMPKSLQRQLQVLVNNVP